MRIKAKEWENKAKIADIAPNIKINGRIGRINKLVIGAIKIGKVKIWADKVIINMLFNPHVLGIFLNQKRKIGNK